MKEKDINLLWSFILRTGMYIGIEEEGRIMSFLYGYVEGTDNQCKFIEILSASISSEFGIKPSSTGCNGQIELVARKLETEWVTIFKRQSLKVLTKEFNNETKCKFSESFRKRLIGKISGIDNFFGKRWIADWFGLVNLSEVWCKSIWSSIEWNLIEAIAEELNSLGKIRYISDEINPTKKLQEICKRFVEEINKTKKES